MSTELDDLGLEDFDFDDDFGFDDNEDIQEGDRNPLDSVRTVAMDELSNIDTYARATQTIAKNALPEGYDEFATGVGDVAEFGKDLLEKANEDLADSKKILRKIALKNKNLVSKILPDSMIEDMERSERMEDESYGGASVDADSATMNSSLESIFKNNFKKENKAEDLKDEAADATTLASMKKTDVVNQLLSRIVSFNDSIAAGYMQKQLELEFKQYFLTRDMLASQKAFYADASTELKAITKNTALPDIIKGTMSEEYAQMAQENLLGRLNESLANRTANYFGNMKENIMAKVSDFTSSVNDGLSIAGEIFSGGMTDGMSEEEKQELYASMAFGMAADGLSAEVGKRLASTLEKYPEVAESGLELLYIKNNMPHLFEDLVMNGNESEMGQKIINLKERFDSITGDARASIKSVTDTVGKTISDASNFASDKVSEAFGAIMPDSVKTQFEDFRERRKEKAALKEVEKEAIKDSKFDEVKVEEEEADIEGAWYIRALRAVMPDLGSDNLQLNNTLLEDGYKSTPLDVAMRTSIVDIIPSLLTEQVRQLTIMNDGDDNNALSYDRITGKLSKSSEAVDRLRDTLGKELGSDAKERRLDAMINLLDPDGYLQDGQRQDVERAILSMAAGFEKTGGMFTYDNLAEALGGSSAREDVQELVRTIQEGDEAARYKNFFSREFGNLRDGFDSGQKQINELAIAGGRQQLMETGLLTQDEKDPTKQVLDRKAYLDLMQEQIASSREKEENEQSLSIPVRGSSRQRRKVDKEDASFVANLPDLVTLQTLVDQSNIKALPVINLYDDEREIERLNFMRDSILAKLESDDNADPNEVRDQAKDESDLLMESVAISSDETSKSISELTAYLKEMLTSYTSASSSKKAEMLRSTIMDKINRDIDAVPVYMPLDLEQEEDPDEALLHLMAEFKQDHLDSSQAVHALLTGILENIQEASIASNDTQVRAGLMKRLGGLARDTGTGFGNFLGRYYTGLGNFFRGAGAGGKDVIEGIGGFFRGRGKAKQKAQNEEDLPEEGSKGNRTSRMSEMLDSITGPIKSLFDMQVSAFGVMQSTGRGIKGAVKAFNDKVENVYVGNEASPRLLASIMRKGGYVSSATGERIYSHKDIDGDVEDLNGNPVLTMDEITRNGLTAKNGKPLSNGRIKDFLKGAKDSAVGIVKTSFDLAKRGAFTSYNAVDKSINTLSSWLKKGSSGKDKEPDPSQGFGDIPTIDLIYSHMKYKWPLSKEDMANKGVDDEEMPSTDELLKEQLTIMKAEQDSKKKNPLDKDGDGFRDGSWQSRQSEKAKADKEDRVKTKKETEKEEKDNLLLTALMGLGGAVSGLGSYLATALGIGAASKAGGAIMDNMPYGPDAPDRNNKRGPKSRGPKGGGKAGLLRKAGRALWTGAKWGGRALLSGGGMLGRAAMFAGRAALSAVVGLGSVAAAKVIAVAAAVYYGYKGVKYLAYGMDAEPLETLRYMQYGFSEKQGGVLRPLRYLEEWVLDEVDFDGERVTYSKPDQDEQLEVLSEEFEFDKSDAKVAKESLMWFNRRFLPVFLHHIGVMRIIDSSVDIDDIDDEIETKDIPKYLRSVSGEIMMDEKVYANNYKPAPELELLATKSDVDKRIDKLLTEYDPEHKQEKAAKKDKSNKDAERKKELQALAKDPEKQKLSKMGDAYVEDNEKEKLDKKADPAKVPKNKDVPKSTPPKVPMKELKKDYLPYMQPSNKHMLVPSIRHDAEGVKEEILNTGGRAAMLANGDIVVSTKSANDLKIFEDGEITKFGYHPDFGVFVEMLEEDGNRVVYKDLKQVPPNIGKGKKLKAGDIIGKGTSYKFSTPNKRIKTSDGKIIKASLDTERYVKDAIVSQTSLPKADIDSSIRSLINKEPSIRTAFLNNDSKEYNDDYMLSEQAKVFEEKLENRPVLRAPKREINPGLDVLTSMVNNSQSYYAKAISQRDEMIEILNEIYNCLKDPKDPIRKVETTPTPTAPKKQPKQAKTTVPMNFNRRQNFI